MTSWSTTLPRDVRNIITSYQEYNDAHIILNPQKHILRYEAQESDTDKTIEKFVNFRMLDLLV